MSNELINPNEVREGSTIKQSLSYAVSIDGRKLRERLGDIAKREFTNLKMDLRFNQTGEEMLDNFEVVHILEYY